VLPQRVRQTSATLSGFANCMRGPWEYEDPSCASVGGDFWFPEIEKGVVLLSGSDGRRLESQVAKSICKSCIHKIECQQWGLKHERFGIWGGLAEPDRNVVRKRLNIIVEEVSNADIATSVGYSPHQSNTST
jgi:hypothetical protein